MICASCGEATETGPCARCGNEPRLDGRYALMGPLGRGSSGRIWAAEGPSGPVAVKEIPLPKGPGARKARELVGREADVLSQLRHPGIPAFVERILVQEGRREVVWLVEERIDGESLAEEAVHRRYTAEEVLNIVDEVLGILAYLHSLSPPVVHRDVKPANIMRRKDGRLVLIDFGAVRDALREHGGSTVAGTFGYMAPEQLVGDASPASDIYSVGMLALALATRRAPSELADRRGEVDHAGTGRVGEVVSSFVRAAPTDRPRDASDALRTRSPRSLRAVEFRRSRPIQWIDRALDAVPKLPRDVVLVLSVPVAVFGGAGAGVIVTSPVVLWALPYRGDVGGVFWGVFLVTFVLSALVIFVEMNRRFIEFE